MIGKLVYLAAVNIPQSQLTGLPTGNLGSNTVTNALRLVFGLAGAIALLVVTIAGLKYVLSQGNPQETAKAKDTILYAIIGLVICMLGYGIVTFVLGNI